MQRWVGTSLVHLREETFKCLGSYVTKNNTLPMMKYPIKNFTDQTTIASLQAANRVAPGDLPGKGEVIGVALPDWRQC
jgi:hypothetical protein